MTTLLVDGNNILARSVHAAKGGRVQMSVEGVNTAALVIFIQMLAKYVRQVNPTHVAVCWDAGHKARDEISPAYKSNRPVREQPSEDEGSTPWNQAKGFLGAMGIPHYSVPGYEADDLIAVFATAEATVKPVVILSGDKDLLQLVDGVTTQIRPGSSPGKIDEVWDTDRVAEEIGILPAHMPLYMSMVGDTSDNIVGVKGIGPKKAISALEKAGWDWDLLLKELGPEKAQEAILARRLVDLRYPEWAAWNDDLLPVLMGRWVIPAFEPTTPAMATWDYLEGFLKRWRLASVEERVRDGSLWHHDRTAEVGSAESVAAFENFDPTG